MIVRLYDPKSGDLQDEESEPPDLSPSNYGVAILSSYATQIVTRLAIEPSFNLSFSLDKDTNKLTFLVLSPE